MAEREGYDDLSATGHKETAALGLWGFSLRRLKRSL